MKDNIILYIERQADEDNLQRYCLEKNLKCIAIGKAEHQTILNLFYKYYSCQIKYVDKITVE